MTVGKLSGWVDYHWSILGGQFLGRSFYKWHCPPYLVHTTNHKQNWWFNWSDSTEEILGETLRENGWDTWSPRFISAHIILLLSPQHVLREVSRSPRKDSDYPKLQKTNESQVPWRSHSTPRMVSFLDIALVRSHSSPRYTCKISNGLLGYRQQIWGSRVSGSSWRHAMTRICHFKYRM